MPTGIKKLGGVKYGLKVIANAINRIYDRPKYIKKLKTYQRIINYYLN